MNRTTVVTYVAVNCIVSLIASHALAKEPSARPKWDQDEALNRVKRVIEIENEGDLPWDKISWETDIEKAAARSQKENKPLFVYFFLKKNIGPAAAPC